MTATEGRVAFHARVAVNVLGMVERELELGAAQDAEEHDRLVELLGRDGTVRELTEVLATRHPRRQPGHPVAGHRRRGPRDRAGEARGRQPPLAGSSPEGAHVRIATWNVNSLKARMPRVEEWLEYAQPDVLAMQETKLKDEAFPSLAFSGLGYDSVPHGHNQWNGVAILSKVGIEDVTTRLRLGERGPVRGRRPGHRREVRRRQHRLRLRAERPRGRDRILRPQARLVRSAPRLDREDVLPGGPTRRSSATSTSRPRTATCGRRRRSSARRT